MGKLQDISIRYLKGIGPKRAKLFNKLGIYTVEDILYYFPKRYEDRAKFQTISQLKEKETPTIKARVLVLNDRQSWKRKGFNIFELVVGDNTGKIFCVWFNQPYLKNYFKVGQTVILYGKIERYLERLQMSSPEFEIISDSSDEKCDESLNIGRIVPIYSLSQSLTQRYFRLVMKNTLDGFLPKINDFLPYDLRKKNNLLNLAKSLISIHFPDNLDLQKEAYRRLSFEEFFLFQILLTLRKLNKKQKPGIIHRIEGGLSNTFIESLPFQLTVAQKKVIEEIKSDMARPFAMQRLLQGDVGSGKTVVAVIASIIAIQGGYQVAFMVPTEILAKQHFEKIKSQVPATKIGWSASATRIGGCANICGANNFGGTSHKSQVSKIKIGLLVSSLNKKEKEKVLQEIKEGKIDLVIGTHALLEEAVEFKNLGLVVIDEQHKFGVGQRALLPAKGANPDVLIMTATPIPRTLAITLYGDLDVSIINELPPGRLPVKTTHFTKGNKSSAYEIAKAQLRQGYQVYIVYPVIEESYVLDIAGAKKMYSELRAGIFKEFKLGLIHGRLKQSEQDEIMSKFKRKELDVLVSTTVLEVGIDIPNATCMLVESAERFGLSQLHQLRGRVGRGKDESFCILISEAQTQEAKARLEAMVKHNDGFRIAEEDLKIRGPGEFFGLRQHGLSELKVANPLAQMQLLKKAREEAIRLINIDPYLNLKQNLLLREKLLQRFPEYEKLMLVG